MPIRVRPSDLESAYPEHIRVRDEGTRNLVAAAGSARVIAASVAFPPGADAHEQIVLDAGGVVLRSGRWDGPGTWFEHALAPAPRIDVVDAARRTVDALDAPPGSVLEVVDEA